jgi:hypothetical protein
MGVTFVFILDDTIGKLPAFLHVKGGPKKVMMPLSHTTKMKVTWKSLRRTTMMKTMVGTVMRKGQARDSACVMRMGRGRPLVDTLDVGRQW